MRARRRLDGWLPAVGLAWVVGLAWLVGGAPAQAAEPFEEFVAALKERRYHDVALDYLQMMQDSPLLNAEQKASIPLMQGGTLVDQAQYENDPNQKAKQLDAASERLNEFVKANSNHPMLADAAMELGIVLVQRGKMILGNAELPSNAGKKADMVKEARGLFEQAKKTFGETATKFEAEWRAFPAALDQVKDAKQVAARTRAQQSAIRAMMLAAETDYETAKTYPAGSKEHKAMLQQAADSYEKVYETFRLKLAGLLARIKQGQCLQEMGETPRAIGLYSEIMSQPDEPEVFRQLKTAAMVPLLQCYISDKEHKYELATIKGDEWLQKQRPNDARKADWLAVRYLTGEAYFLLANDTHKDDATKRGRDLAKAKEYATTVEKVESPYRGSAKGLLEKVFGEGGIPNAGPPKTFAEALQRGQDAMKEMNVYLTQNDTVQASEAAGRAREVFVTALSMATHETSRDDLNNVRYSICYLDYNAGRFYDSAVMGEFIARNYFESAGARTGAQIALGSYSKTLNDQSIPADQRASDFDHMVSVAEYIAQRWPEETAAHDALGTLAALAVTKSDLKKAYSYLEKIPESSPRRAETQLMLGKALWAEYVTAQNKQGEERPPQAELDKMLADSQAMLENGVEGLQKSVAGGTAVTGDTILAPLFLTEIYVRSSQLDKALALLEDEKVGPLTLVNDDHPATTGNNVQAQVLTLALQAYVGKQQLDDAGEILGKLRELTGDDDAGKARLNRILISMGMKLQEQIKDLIAQGKQAEADKVSQAFEKFLGQITSGSEGNSFSSLEWLASSYLSLGKSYDTGAKQIDPKAKAYYEKAVEMDKKLIEAAEKDPNFVPRGADGQPNEDALLAIKLRDAQCLRRLGRYKDAIDLLEAVVKTRQLIEAQKEAALTFMDWGAAENPAYYNLATGGARKDPATGSKTLWGWGRLSIWAQNNPKANDDFFEARWQVSNCLKLQAEHPDTPADKKTELLKSAQGEIVYTERLRENFGGPPWDAKYDTLLKNIQKQLGEDPIGIKALQPPPATAAN